MMRVCFTLNVRKDMLGEYRRRHAEVWPELPGCGGLEVNERWQGRWRFF